jgi:glyoxylase-like metal-dependent hydrolase (beta-lactamase superfamily II)
MYLDRFDRNPYQENCWLLAAEGSDDAIVVDPGSDPAAVRALLDAAGRTPVAILLTHAHVDHAAQAGELAGDDLPVFVHPADAVAFRDPEAWSPGFANPLAPVKDLREVQDGDILGFGGFSIEVLHTPGHTPGHCCFRLSGDVVLLGGDLVFAGAIGRSDFPNSDPDAMQASLRRFLTLPDELRVLPGHGPETTVGRERGVNPFLVGMR